MNTEEKMNNSPLPSSQANTIYLLLLDSKPYCYCDDYTQAKDVAYNFLNEKPRETNRFYYIDDTYTYSTQLYSSEKFHATVYDRLENEIEIVPINKKE